jgi:hypothetical protein
MAYIIGSPLAIFGIPDEIKPVKALPMGKTRLRLRPEDFARVFVRTETGIRGFHLTDAGDHWLPVFEFGINKTIQ